MSVISQETVRQLAGLRHEDHPVTTCYLDVDGGHHPRIDDCETELARVVREAGANGSSAVPSADVERITTYLRNDLDRSRTRGIVFLSCAAHDLWEVIELPVPLRSRVVVDAAPALAQLEAILQESERVGVIAAEKYRARLVVFELGEVVEQLEVIDSVPRDVDSVGHRDHTPPTAHAEELVAQHLRHTAKEAFSLFERCRVRHVVIATSDPLVSALEHDLHPYLRERLRGRLSLRVDAPIDELRTAVLEAEHRFETEREAALVDKLRAAVAKGERGAAGLGATLAAVTDRRAEHLLISDGYAASGWHCGGCGVLAEVGRTCERCGAEMAHVDDIVEEAIDEALLSGCHVEVCSGNADLDVLGRIGALLRF